jgi:hypothetical protein
MIGRLISRVGVAVWAILAWLALWAALALVLR